MFVAEFVKIQPITEKLRKHADCSKQPGYYLVAEFSKIRLPLG